MTQKTLQYYRITTYVACYSKNRYNFASAQAYCAGQKGKFGMKTLTVDRFIPQVETTFLCRLENGDTYTMRLVEATETGRQRTDRTGLAAPSERLPFSLIFLGPADVALPQSIYRLEHAEMGALSIFLVPISRDAAGTRYQAIFT